MSSIEIIIFILVIFAMIFILFIEPRISKRKLENKNEHGSSKFADMKEIEKTFIKEDLNCSGMVKHFHDILISATDVTSCCKNLFEQLKSSNKAPFAINLLFMEEFEHLKTPAYIEEGLDWLNQLLNSNE